MKVSITEYNLIDLVIINITDLMRSVTYGGSFMPNPFFYTFIFYNSEEESQNCEFVLIAN